MEHLSEISLHQSSLLTTKLYIPRATPSLVSRPRLIAELDKALRQALTIVSAPAGFGKTTLLSEWASQAGKQGSRRAEERISPVPLTPYPPAKVAWFSLDEADNDPARLLSYLVAALKTIWPDIGQATLATLPASASQGVGAQSSRGQTAWLKATLTTLINEITPNVGEFVLILDDYHLITAPVVHKALTFLLEHLPPQMHVVIAGRSEPPLPVARLRAQGQLLELRTADLRFTSDEAANFLNQVMDLNLSIDDIAALEAKTEGWITGLQLAALSMQDRPDISGFITTFTGSHRYILDYLAEEVLSRQPGPVWEFLLKTSILERLYGPLCDAVLGRGAEVRGSREELGKGAGEQGSRGEKNSPPPPRTSAQETLAYLEQANLFIFPLDDERRWYRYHHLFADFLRDRLEHQIGTEGVATLHRRAAEWYERNGLTAEATGHALASADVERAARLIEQGGRTMLKRSELSTLLSWVKLLPEEVVRARPRLSLFNAWALVLTGRLDAVEAHLRDVEDNLRQAQEQTDIPGEMTAIRATLAYFRRDIPQAIGLYREAFERLPQGNLFLRGAVAMSLATACHLQGDLSQAKWAFAEAKTIGQADHNLYTTLIASLNLADLHVIQAEFHQALACYQQASQLMTPLDPGTLPHLAGRVYVGLANVFYEWNDLVAAAEHLDRGLAFGEQKGDVITLISGQLALARVKQAQGDLVAAMKALEQAAALSQRNHWTSWQVRLAAYQVQLSLKQGDLEAARRWAQRAETNLGSDNLDDSAGFFEDLRRVEQLARVRLLIAQQQPDEAAALLTSLIQVAEAEQRSGQIIKILTLRALAYQAQNDLSQATTTLDQAFALAEPAGYIRLFIDEGEALAELLRYALSRNLTSYRAYADKLLTAFKALPAPLLPRSSAPPLIDPLSDRELEILQLIDDGLSNKQISEKLFLTVGTVKWHINNIYSKLGVRRRTQALVRARELNLL